MANTPRSGSGRETTPRDFPEVNPRSGQPGHDFTLQAVMELQRTIGGLESSIASMRKDREDDRADYRQDVRDMRADFKEFRDKDFKALGEDVSKLKLKWAKVAGGAAIIGAIVTFIGEIVKAKFFG